MEEFYVKIPEQYTISEYTKQNMSHMLEEAFLVEHGTEDASIQYTALIIHLGDAGILVQRVGCTRVLPYSKLLSGEITLKNIATGEIVDFCCANMLVDYE